MKRIAILGSTGSIGTQTLEVVENNQDIQVTALAAGSNIRLLEEQIRKFHPTLACVWDEKKAAELRTNIADLSVKVVSGMDGLLEVAVQPEAEILVTAIVGMIGIRPTIAAMKAGKDIALANKETLVCAGGLVLSAAKQYGVRILPVDSEHSAIFQCVQAANGNPISKILLTASGGPFFGKKFEEMRGMTREQALAHPNWSMGAKITIDSATLMNKGLEIIEAMRLYRLPLRQVDAVIHRQSIVHSLVEFHDGAMLAQLGTPDMKLPIRYAMTYPNRAVSPAEPLDLLKCPPLTFAEPDEEVFRCLKIAKQCAAVGNVYCAAMNGANEEAVAAFLRDEIGICAIPDLIEAALDKTETVYQPQLSDILEADRLAREVVREKLN